MNILNEFAELDIIALTTDIPESGLFSGQVGTIVALYDQDNFEVEFIDNEGQTYGLLPLNKDQVMALHFAPMK